MNHVIYVRTLSSELRSGKDGLCRKFPPLSRAGVGACMLRSNCTDGRVNRSRKLGKVGDIHKWDRGNEVSKGEARQIRSAFHLACEQRR